MHANIKLNILNEKLNNAKEVGLIKQIITSKNDQPILNWKTNITLH